MEFILYCRKKLFCNRSVFVIICREGINIGNLLIKATLTGSDLPNALQQFVKVIFTENLIALLKPFIIQNKPFDDEFFQGPCGPYSELRGLVGIDTVTDGDDGIEVIELHFPLDLSISFILNCFQNRKSCFLL